MSSSSTTWEQTATPYTSNNNSSSSNNNNPASSSIIVHSNGPGGGIQQQQTVTEATSPRGPPAIHQPSPTYSTVGPPYLHHPPPYSHSLPPGTSPYPPHPPSAIGTPAVIHPYPPPSTTPTTTNPLVPGGPYHPHYSSAPPPPYAAPIQHSSGHHHASHPPPISPTHTTPLPPSSIQHQQLPPGPPPSGPLSLHHHLGGPPPPPTVGHHGPPPYNLKVNPNVVVPHHQQPPGPGPLPPPHPGGLGPGPVPQTPIGPPVGGNPFANASGPELDLHPELVAIGWRKFWSKRESRWYFWNCNSGESLWELPPLPGRHHPPPAGGGGYDVITDPLGISCNNGPPAHLAGVKRRSSSGEHLTGAGPVKKFILSGPWDLEISSNAMTSESVIPSPSILPPNPEIELMRYQLVVKLRQCYQQSCQSREGIDAPKESLNRWFVERKMHDRRGVDPIFPSCDEADGVVSQVMFKEIMNDIPIKILKPRFTGDARKQLSKFADACKKIIETRNATAEARKLVKWKVEETFSWLRSTSGAPFEAFQERLVHLKVTCQPHVHIAAKSSVEGICKKMSVLSKQYASTVRESHLKLFADPDSVKQDTKPEIGRFRCYPAICGAYSFTDAGKLPTIEFMQQDRDHVLLKFKNDVVRLTTQYLQKLEQLYRYNCIDDRKFEFFLARCYCLMKRYNAFCEDYISPHSSQGSLPITVFESIQRNFGVSFECFASPLNCYFRQFCSSFPDTDGYFGSRGTFLDFKPVGGSYQLNPPVSEDLIDSAITHVEDLLGGSKEAMSFVIFVPDFAEDKEGGEEPENECNWLKRLENSRWKRKKITIPAFEHEFRHGGQHLVPKSDVSIRNPHTTVVFWLQNDAGFEEWEPTDQKVDSLIDCFRPGRERERDRQQYLDVERKNPQPADKAVAAAMASSSMTPVN